jgi:acyl-CoA synthetase (AMP-forming)/AMP-acid ligase II/acyl carrier protein
VALVLPNGIEIATAFLAVAASATCVPINPAYSASEYDFYLAVLRVKALIVQTGIDTPARHVARARGVRIIELTPTREAEAGLFTLAGEDQPCPTPPGVVQPNDVGLVLHTTGTSARPKIVPLTHRNLCASAAIIRAALELTEKDRCLNVMPFFHGHSLKGMLLSSLFAGASVMCTSDFSAPTFFAWMAAYRPTWYSAVPTMHQAVLAHAAAHRQIIADTPLRFIRSSSAFLPPQVLAELESVFNVPVIEAYGTTEASMITCNPLPPRRRKAGSGGIAVGQEVAIMDAADSILPPSMVGEIVVRGAAVMQGYENNPVANRSAFTHSWFRTGDVGYLDADGYLFITGRIKEIINRGGEKIAPREIEEVLMKHPAVAEVAAFAMPHTQLGEEVAAAIVLRENASATASEIHEFAVARLSNFKIPRQVIFIDEIPKGATGKVQRNGLAAELGLSIPDSARPELAGILVAPRTSWETLLAEIWCSVLDVEHVGVYDNFFDLGGHSLLAMQVITRVEKRTGLQISPRDLMFQTLGQLAAACEAYMSLPSKPIGFLQKIRHALQGRLQL